MNAQPSTRIEELSRPPLFSQSDLRRRKWVVVLAFVLLVLITAAGIFLLATRGLPDDARAELSRYLAYRYASVPLPTISEVSAATRSWQFPRERSGASYSDTIHYRTTAFLNVSTQWRSDRALPYPPNEVWCVRLDGAAPGAEVVFVALHADMYNAGWVVHELPAAWSVAERRAVLADLDCKIRLTD